MLEYLLFFAVGLLIGFVGVNVLLLYGGFNKVDTTEKNHVPIDVSDLKWVNENEEEVIKEAVKTFEYHFRSPHLMMGRYKETCRVRETKPNSAVFYKSRRLNYLSALECALYNLSEHDIITIPFLLVVVVDGVKFEFMFSTFHKEKLTVRVLNPGPSTKYDSFNKISDLKFLDKLGKETIKALTDIKGGV